MEERALQGIKAALPVMERRQARHLSLVLSAGVYGRGAASGRAFGEKLTERRARILEAEEL